MTHENISTTIGFHGVWVDVLIPLQADFSIDEPKLASHLRNLSAKGFENFVMFGHAGEGTSFSADEKLAAVAHVIEAGVEANNLLLGVNSSSYAEVAQFIRKASAKGVRRFWYQRRCMTTRTATLGCLTILINWSNKSIKATGICSFTNSVAKTKRLICQRSHWLI